MRWITLACAAATAAALLAAGCGGDDDVPASNDPRPALVVTKASDDGTDGTLRWAIQRSNAEPGKYRIVLTPPSGGGELAIKPTSALPAIVGPARIEGPWTGTGTPTVAVDGSSWIDLSVQSAPGITTNCPGEVAGQFGPNTRSLKNVGLQVVDTSKVEITGFEVRNFCTGVMLLRSGDNQIHHMRFFRNLGAAGVLITGDDGTPAGGATVGKSLNNVLERSEFLNNSDALDIARGSDGTIVRFNTFTVNAQGTPSSGIEVLSSNGVVFEDNTIDGYATAFQLGGDRHVFNRNTLNNNAIAVQMGGTGYKFTANIIRNGRTAVIQTTGGTKLNTLSQNRIYANGKDLDRCAPLNGQSTVPDAGVCLTKEWLTSRISIGLAGFSATSTPNDAAAACADNFADCTAPQNTPVLAVPITSGGFTLTGTLTTRPNEAFVVEYFASHTSGPDGKGEGEIYLGKQDVNSGTTGVVNLSFPAGTSDPLKDGTKAVFFTATATRVSNGQTSEFSAPQQGTAP